MKLLTSMALRGALRMAGLSSEQTVLVVQLAHDLKQDDSGVTERALRSAGVVGRAVSRWRAEREG